jgi:hypothetical protein
MFCEQLDYNLLFRWFLDLNWDEPSFDHSSFSRNRGRLLEHDVASEFFRTVVAEARELKLTSDQHFTVDGTLIQAWASRANPIAAFDPLIIGGIAFENPANAPVLPAAAADIVFTLYSTRAKAFEPAAAKPSASAAHA